ncbi:MAG: hypothetical protein HWD85_04650 [Flavobacteriaceae bacterium]|nr:hypothetical protein [Flavobacteriaceae bacterium]
MKYKLLFIAFYGITLLNLNAQDLAFNNKNLITQFEIKDYYYSIANDHSKKDSIKTRKTQFFIGYDFGEAAFNKFQSLGGEIGVKFKNNHQVRLSHTSIRFTEAHLSSSFAGAVDGKNVKGKQFGFELFYDFPVFFNGFYISPSLGYYDNEYTHTNLNEKLEKASFTVGSAISFTEVDIFKVKGLYYRVSLPYRYTFNPHKKTKLGETTIKSNTFDSHLWFFVGYQF